MTRSTKPAHAAIQKKIKTVMEEMFHYAMLEAMSPPVIERHTSYKCTKCDENSALDDYSYWHKFTLLKMGDFNLENISIIALRRFRDVLNAFVGKAFPFNYNNACKTVSVSIGVKATEKSLDNVVIARTELFLLNQFAPIEATVKEAGQHIEQLPKHLQPRATISLLKKIAALQNSVLNNTKV